MISRNTWKLIALDMDGTLLRTDKSIHPDTAADIAAACEAGIEVVYCSGRSPVELLPYREQLPGMRYAVCLSGAFVWDLQENRCISEQLIPREQVLRLAEAAQKYDAMLHLLSSEQSVVREDLIERMPEFNMESFQELYRKVATGVPDLREEILRRSGFHKVNIYFRSPLHLREALEELRSLPLTAACTEKTMLETNAAGVSKARGLRSLARHLGISMHSTMAVGDSENDRAVLEAAGFSVAMKNAEEAIRSLCDAVTDDNEHNGVGKAIRKYCNLPGSSFM